MKTKDFRAEKARKRGETVEDGLKKLAEKMRRLIDCIREAAKTQQGNEATIEKLAEEYSGILREVEDALRFLKCDLAKAVKVAVENARSRDYLHGIVIQGLEELGAHTVFFREASLQIVILELLKNLKHAFPAESDRGYAVIAEKGTASDHICLAVYDSGAMKEGPPDKGTTTISDLVKAYGGKFFPISMLPDSDPLFEQGYRKRAAIHLVRCKPPQERP